MITKAPIKIPRKITNQLLHLAQISPNIEICGLIGSKNGFPTHCYPIKNVAKFPESNFLLDSSQQISAMKSMRDLGEHFFAIYHSHPTAPALPSAEDINLTSYPDVLHLIISLNTKGILEMRGFKIHENTSLEMPLTMNDD
jgi:proteasome lid subunit RPN8/RPN11